MADFVLNAEIRASLGKGSRRIRATGKTPGVYYGHGDENLHIQVLATRLAPLVFTSKTNIIDLQIENQASKKCVVKDVQFDPVTDLPIHFDLQGLRENEQLTIDIPVVLVGGVPKGVRESGGRLQQLMHKIKILCLPRHIPEKIEINVADLEIHMGVHIRDLSLPDVEILDTEDQTIVAVLPPTVEKEPTPEEAATEVTAEPEVVGKGKKDEDDEEGDGEKKKED